MSRYVALIDGKAGAYGVVVPDLAGCTSGGRSIDAALRNVVDAVRLWARRRARRWRNFATRAFVGGDVALPIASPFTFKRVCRQQGRKALATPDCRRECAILRGMCYPPGSVSGTPWHRPQPAGEVPMIRPQPDLFEQPS